MGSKTVCLLKGLVPQGGSQHVNRVYTPLGNTVPEPSESPQNTLGQSFFLKLALYCIGVMPVTCRNTRQKVEGSYPKE